MYLEMLLTFMFMNIFQIYVYLQERKRSEIIRGYKNILHLQKQVEAKNVTEFRKKITVWLQGRQNSHTWRGSIIEKTPLILFNFQLN